MVIKQKERKYDSNKEKTIVFFPSLFSDALCGWKLVVLVDTGSI